MTEFWSGFGEGTRVDWETLKAKYTAKVHAYDTPYMTQDPFAAWSGEEVRRQNAERKRQEAIRRARPFLDQLNRDIEAAAYQRPFLRRAEKARLDGFWRDGSYFCRCTCGCKAAGCANVNYLKRVGRGRDTDAVVLELKEALTAEHAARPLVGVAEVSVKEEPALT